VKFGEIWRNLDSDVKKTYYETSIKNIEKELEKLKEHEKNNENDLNSNYNNTNNIKESNKIEVSNRSASIISKEENDDSFNINEINTFKKEVSNENSEIFEDKIIAFEKNLFNNVVIINEHFNKIEFKCFSSDYNYEFLLKLEKINEYLDIRLLPFPFIENFSCSYLFESLRKNYKNSLCWILNDIDEVFKHLVNMIKKNNHQLFIDGIENTYTLKIEDKLENFNKFLCCEFELKLESTKKDFKKYYEKFKYKFFEIYNKNNS